MAGTQQRQRGRKPANARADDHDAQCFLHAKANSWEITSACDPDCNRSLLIVPTLRGMTSGEAVI
jgi:hypothetical protein